MSPVSRAYDYDVLLLLRLVTPLLAPHYPRLSTPLPVYAKRRKTQYRIVYPDPDLDYNSINSKGNGSLHENIHEEVRDLSGTKPHALFQGRMLVPTLTMPIVHHNSIVLTSSLIYAPSENFRNSYTTSYV